MECRPRVGSEQTVRGFAGGKQARGGADVIWLDVDEDDLPARRLYESVGFSTHHCHGELRAKF